MSFRHCLLLIWPAASVAMAQTPPDLREAARLDREGKCTEAERLYVRALAAAKPSDALLNNTGNHYIVCGNPAKATEYFQLLLRRNPAHPNANLQLARLMARAGDLARARKMFEGYVARHPQDPAGHFELAQLYWNINAEKSLSHLAATVRLAPRFAPAYTARAWLLHRLGRDTEALKHVETALQLAPKDAPALDQYGLILLALDRPKEAEKVFRQAAAIAPENSEVALHLGRTLMEQGRHEEARVWLDRSQKLRAKRPAPAMSSLERLEPRAEPERGPTAQQQRFTDVTARSTFRYVTNNGFAQRRKYFVQPLAGGIAVLDYDNDGLMDLYFTNGARFPELKKTGPEFHNALLRNKGAGVFEDVTERSGLAGENLGYSLGAAAGDYDNDGFTDLFVANAGRNTLYRNQGDGTFRDVSASSGLGVKPAGTLSVQGAWLDFDHDGQLDLVLSNYTLWTASTDKRCVRADGVDFYCHPNTYPNVPHRLYRNNGDGTFKDVTEAAGFGAARGKGMGIGISDVNGDGWSDIFIANDTEPNFLYINQRNETFREQGLLMGVAYNDDAATVSAMGADVRDFDNDGWPDVFYNDLTNQVWGLFRNLGGKSFRYVSGATGLVPLTMPFSGWSAGFFDYNNDGWRDLYSANGDVDSLRTNAEQHDTVFENVEGKRFVDVSPKMGTHFQRKGYQRGAAFADLNNDGFMDLIVTSLNRPPAILLNSGAGGGHWLKIRAVGRKANRDSSGARITLTTSSGRVLRDWVSPSVGFLSSSDPRVHFGLGDETRVASVEVVWPGGGTVVMKDIEADRILTAVEAP